MTTSYIFTKLTFAVSENLIKSLTIIMCPVDETGKNSVIPSIIAIIIDFKISKISKLFPPNKTH